MHTFKSFACAAIDNFSYFESFISALPNQKDKVRWELDFFKCFSFFTSVCFYVCVCPSFLQKIKGRSMWIVIKAMGLDESTWKEHGWRVRALLSGAQIMWGTQTLIIVQEDRAANNVKVATRGAGEKP